MTPGSHPLTRELDRLTDDQMPPLNVGSRRTLLGRHFVENREDSPKDLPHKFWGACSAMNTPSIFDLFHHPHIIVSLIRDLQ